MTGEELQDRFIDFAASIGLLVDRLPDGRLARHIAGQLVRSGTSPAPNYAEGCAAQSKADFIHKLSIVQKELRETNVWLRLIVRASLAPEAEVSAIRQECHELTSIITASLVTAKGRRDKPAQEVEAKR